MAEPATHFGGGDDAPNHRNRESTSDGRMVNNDYSGGLRC